MAFALSSICLTDDAGYLRYIWHLCVFSEPRFIRTAHQATYSPVSDTPPFISLFYFEDTYGIFVLLIREPGRYLRIMSPTREQTRSLYTSI